jgi:hypothetical protein
MRAFSEVFLGPPLRPLRSQLPDSMANSLS